VKNREEEMMQKAHHRKKSHVWGRSEKKVDMGLAVPQHKKMKATKEKIV
jgi:hypothetical protein